MGNTLKVIGILFGAGAITAAGYVGTYYATSSLIECLQRKIEEKKEKKNGVVKNGFEFIDVEYKVVAEY